MELYNSKDLKLVDENIDIVIENIEEKRKKLYPRPNDIVSDTDSVKSYDLEKPTSPDIIEKIINITIDFIKNKKRIIYGGYSQNAVVKIKNKNDAFYSDDEIADIDVYSPNPIEDLVELCDKLFLSGFTDVVGREAMHKETYKIFTNKYNAIDLSYVPKQIYDNIPYINIDNIKYVHPSFSMIDLYKMMSEPLFSSWRWKKIFKRLYLLQKYYPFPIINLDEKLKHKNDILQIFEVIDDFITNNENVYLFGDIAYNEYVKQANDPNVKEIDVYSYKIVSSNYKNDAKKLIKELNKFNITYEEHYQFWSFTGHNVEIYYKNELVAIIYDNLKRCCPINIIENKKGKIQIGSFDYTLLMEMIISFREKVLKNTNQKKYHDGIITNLIKIRKYYFNKNNKTLLDTSLFQSFISTCIGETVDPMMEAKNKWKKRKEKKGSAMFSYKPVKTLTYKWVFNNTSGNKINNPKNLKLSKK